MPPPRVEGCPDTRDKIDQYDRWFGVLITLNAVAIGVETDWRSVGDYAVDPKWYAMEVVFSLGFLLELFLRVQLLGLAYFRQLANCADCFLVIAAVVDTFILTWMSDTA